MEEIVERRKIKHNVGERDGEMLEKDENITKEIGSVDRKKIGTREECEMREKLLGEVGRDWGREGVKERRGEEERAELSVSK